MGKIMRKRNFKNGSSKLTVGLMLKYIKDNNIPMNAEVVVEHVKDVYLSKYKWPHYLVHDEIQGFDNTMLPIHNGMGWIEDKKYFALWMHY